MMTYDEIVNLLTTAALYDNREPDDEGLIAAVWQRASELAGWTYPEALDALYAHFAESKDYLMPAHITERIRIDRRYRATPPALVAGQNPVASPERQRDGMAEIGAILQRNKPPIVKTWDRNTHVKCPWCKAGVGFVCTTPQGKPLTKSPCHPARAEVADQLAEDEAAVARDARAARDG